MTINIGIIGCGYMGGVHARNLGSDSRVKLVGVADVAANRAADLARSSGAQAFASATELLDAGADAVYVTTPNTLHTEAVLQALAHGVHVFSEKPMATQFAEALQIREAARVAKGIYQVGHNRRFAPVYLFCQEQIRAVKGQIEQAKGMVAERNDLQIDDAFERLRTYARANGLRLTAVATGVVNRTIGL